VFYRGIVHPPAAIETHGAFDPKPTAASQQRAIERAIDIVLDESFPASDPPSWTPGIARPPSAGDNSTTRGRNESNSGDRQQ
jgi:hypothetical protein